MNNDARQLVHRWFAAWETGSLDALPITDDFRHTSPFDTIEGKAAYLELVEKDRDKFLGHRFELHDGLYAKDRACVRYTSHKDAFSLDVSEWYSFRDGLISEITAYYHIGEVREERRLEGE